jgi:hypothetical protein
MHQLYSSILGVVAQPLIRLILGMKDCARVKINGIPRLILGTVARDSAHVRYTRARQWFQIHSSKESPNFSQFAKLHKMNRFIASTTTK